MRKPDAQWGFDFLKYDWCSYGSVADGAVANPLNVPVRKNSRNVDYAIHPFKVMGGFLRAQPRDIIFSSANMAITTCGHGARRSTAVAGV